MLALAVSRRNSIWCRITCTWSRRKARNTTNKAFCHFCSSLPSASALQSHFGRKIHQQQGLQTDGGSKCRMWYWSYKEVNKEAPGISSFSVAWFWHSLRLWLSRPLLWRTWVPSKFQNTHTKCHPQGFLTTFVTQINHVNTCRLHSTLTFGATFKAHGFGPPVKPPPPVPCVFRRHPLCALWKACSCGRLHRIQRMIRWWFDGFSVLQSVEIWPYPRMVDDSRIRQLCRWVQNASSKQ